MDIDGHRRGGERLSYDETTLALWVLTIATFCGFFFIAATEDAEADSAEPGFTAVTTLVDDDEYAGYYNGYVAHAPPMRQMNGTLWVFDNFVTIANSVQSLWGHFSTDKGDTWSDILIMDETDPDFAVGGYPRNIIDGAMLSNNSIIILVELYGWQTNDNHELWLFCHWNNTDLSQWEMVPVYVSETYHNVNKWAQIVVGDDDTIYSYNQKGPTSTMYFKSWDMTTRVGTTIFTKYPAYGGNKFWFMIDSTEQLYFAWANGASPEILYTYLIPEGTLYCSRGGSSSYYWRDCMMTLDDTQVAIVSWGTGGQYDYLWYYNGSGSGFTQIMSPNQVLTYPKFSLCQSVPTRVYIFSLSPTQDHFAYKAQNYYASSTAWKASYVEVWEDTENSVKSYGWIGPRDHFPQMYSDIEEEMVYTQVPDTGWIFPFSDYDVAMDDWDHYIIHMSSTTWMSIPFYMGPAPNIATVALDDGTYGTWYEFTVTGEDGETPYIWSLLVGPGWLSIGSANGTLYGDPGGVGSSTVTVRLTETHDAPRSDDETWTLKINSASSDGDEPVSSTFIFDDIGEMWMLLALTATFVALARTWKMATYRRDQG